MEHPLVRRDLVFTLAMLAAVSTFGCSNGGGKCGSDSAFDVVACGNDFDPSGFCPANSVCTGSGCECNAGYVAVDCSGEPCSGNCVAPNYSCEPPASTNNSGQCDDCGGSAASVAQATSSISGYWNCRTTDKWGVIIYKLAFSVGASGDSGSGQGAQVPVIYDPNFGNEYNGTTEEPFTFDWSLLSSDTMAITNVQVTDDAGISVQLAEIAGIGTSGTPPTVFQGNFVNGGTLSCNIMVGSP